MGVGGSACEAASWTSRRGTPHITGGSAVAETVGPDPLVDPRYFRQPSDHPGGRVTVQAGPAPGQENGASVSFPGGQVHRPGGARASRSSTSANRASTTPPPIPKVAQSSLSSSRPRPSRPARRRRTRFSDPVSTRARVGSIQGSKPGMLTVTTGRRTSRTRRSVRSGRYGWSQGSHGATGRLSRDRRRAARPPWAPHPGDMAETALGCADGALGQCRRPRRPRKGRRVQGHILSRVPHQVEVVGRAPMMARDRPGGPCSVRV